MRSKLVVTVIIILASANLARAQTQSGSIQGTVVDETGAPLELVTVVASGPALQQPQTEFTDGSGGYVLTSLPPGMYSMVFLYGTASVSRENVEVSLGKATVVPARIESSVTERITIHEKAPAIDGGSTKMGLTVKQDQLRNIPHRGRTFAGVLESAAGAQDDALGVSFGGSTSVENSYVIDGVNTTGLIAGGVGLPVINNFIQEIEVITGGYNAEFGRSTGGVVNVVTKTGSNELHGSVWANLEPFEAARARTSTASSSISRQDSLAQNFDLGFELGGPIVKDRLWFYVGLAPLVNRVKTERITGTQVDRHRLGFDYGADGCAENSDGTCDGDGDPGTTPAAGCEVAGNCEGDGQPDIDDATGFAIIEEIGRRDYVQDVKQIQFMSKVNLAVGPDHQAQVSLTGTPSVSSRLVNGVAGTENAMQSRADQVTTDAAAKWTSKLLDSRLQLDAVVGWHRDKQNASSIYDTLPNDPGTRTADSPTVQVLDSDPAYANLGVLGNNRDMSESVDTLARCADGVAGDPFPGIVNCPVSSYSMGSNPWVIDRLENRLTARLSVTQRVQALGHHQLKAGADVEANRLDMTQGFTGGAFVQSFADWEVTRFVNMDPDGTDVCGFDDAGAPRMCDYLEDGAPVHGRTLNWSAFLQDAWSILPNLTINAGLRYEQQKLSYAESVRGQVDPTTGRAVGATALHLTDLVSPRLGVIYDWTREGRSRIYASWGRFYESIPMDLNLRAFGGWSTYATAWDWETQCGGPSADARDAALPSQARGCPTGPSADGAVTPAWGDYLLGAPDAAYGIPSGVFLVAPNIKAQYMDELVLGVEYEVLDDLRLGVSYQNRHIGRVIEDLSTDGGTTYFLANPGELDEGAEAALQARIDSMDTDDPVREMLVNRLELFRAVRGFDRPTRRYDALQLTAIKRFSSSFMLEGSYTYSRTEGNYPGLYSADNGQLDPNISAQYDLIELMANRSGPLPADRPHSFKLDGYYTFDLQQAGRVTAGARVRARSGIPRNTLGRNASYGQRESFLLPRGSAGRTAFAANADLHLSYARKLGSTELELFAETFNVFNSQQETAVDNEYTTDVVDPIIGGSDEDLVYAKALGGAPGQLVRRKQNYGNTTARNLPLSVRLGVMLSF